MVHCEIGEVRTFECAAGSGVACTIVAQHGTIMIFDLDRWAKQNELFHPAVEPNLGCRKCALGRPGGESGLQANDGLHSRCRDRNGQLGGFVLDRVQPMHVRPGIIEQAIARAQRPLQ